MAKQMSAKTAILYYENHFNTEILLAKTHFLTQLVISNIKKLSVIWGEIKHDTVRLYHKCKLCCKALNVFKMFNGSLGHVPVVQQPQIYFFDSCIACPRWFCMNLLQELVSCKDDFTQNCSSMVNGKSKVYNTQLHEGYMKIFFCSRYQAISTEYHIIKWTLVSDSFAYTAISKLYYLVFIQTISPHFNKIIRTKMTATLWCHQPNILPQTTCNFTLLSW